MNEQQPSKRIIVGITGASGAPYARRLLDCLLHAGTQVHLVVTPAGQRLLREELGVRDLSCRAIIGRDDDRLVIHPYRDVGAAIASGSLLTDGMIVCPCSSNRLASMAAGLGDNLLDRTAAVTLKERRRLVLLPREMPMSRIDLLNALRLTESGAIICPASPGFYMRPNSIDDLVDFVVGKLLDLMGIHHELNIRWSEQLSSDPNVVPTDTPGEVDA